MRDWLKTVGVGVMALGMGAVLVIEILFSIFGPAPVRCPRCGGTHFHRLWARWWTYVHEWSEDPRMKPEFAADAEWHKEMIVGETS